MPDVVEIIEERVVVTEVVASPSEVEIVSQDDETAAGPQGLVESEGPEDSEKH